MKHTPKEFWICFNNNESYGVFSTLDAANSRYDALVEDYPQFYTEIVHVIERSSHEELLEAAKLGLEVIQVLQKDGDYYNQNLMDDMKKITEAIQKVEGK